MWGIVLGIVLAIGDVLLTPPDQGEVITYVGISRMFVLLAGLALILAWTLVAWLELEGRKRITLPAAAVGLVLLGMLGAGAATSDLYSSEDVPAWRFVVLPGIGLVGVIAGASLLGRDEVTSTRLLLTGMVAIALVGYAQEEALTWALIAGLGITYLWLIPNFSTFSAMTGLVMHALALLAVLQAEPQWFTWTPFPFLTFYPLYVLALTLRGDDKVRRNAWWTGAVVTGLTTLLGFTTLVGNLRRDLPVWESTVMLAGGSILLLVFLLLRFVTFKDHELPAAA